MPYLLSIFNENYHNFLLYLGFFGYKGAQCQKQEVTAQVSTTFSKAPYLWLSIDESVLVVAHFKLVFLELQCRFLYFLTILWTLDLLLSATPKGWKESIGFPDAELHAESLEKKSLKSSNIQEACQTLKISGEAIRSHIISFRFPVE